MIVHVLDEKTINKIAAGEVVERPASVIKELVENSIDASASTITVEIRDGGVSYMRVTDDGIGMAEEDARLCILRHATSKIAAVEDLFAISSLGFRGEALASISAVSKFRLRTRQKDEDMGTEVTVEGGHWIDCIRTGMPLGTTIEVEDLFFNTPARRQFLKTTRTESNAIISMVNKLALTNPHISFRCIVDGKSVTMTPGTDSYLTVATALYGLQVKDSLFPVSYEADGISVVGLVSKPTLLRSSRQWQTIIVNQRVVQDKAVSKAIDNAYHALLPKGGFPLVVLSIIVPPEMVDINVHPRKSEVRFHNDHIVYRAVYHAILNALQNPLQDQRQADARAIEDRFVTEAKEDIVRRYTSAASPADFASGKVEVARSSSLGAPDRQQREETRAFVDKLKSGTYIAHSKSEYKQEEFPLDYDKSLPKSYTVEDRERLHNLLQPDSVARMSYNDGIPGDGVPGAQAGALGGGQMSAVDGAQSGAVSGVQSGADCGFGNAFGENQSADAVSVNGDGQGTVAYGESVSPAGLAAAEAQPSFTREPRLETSGLIPFGQVASCYIVAKKGDELYIIDQHAAHERVRYDMLCKSAASIPMQDLLFPLTLNVNDEELALVEEKADVFADLGFAVDLGGPHHARINGAPVDIKESAYEDMFRFICSYLLDHGVPTKAQLRHEMLAYASCRGAIKSGHNLNLQQMSDLIEALFHTDKPYVCPHGRPTIIKFTSDELAKLFLRS